MYFEGTPANIAYNRTVYLSKPYTYSPPTSYIVDNSSSTDYWTSCCSTGDGGGGPNWFVIDLVEEFHVYYVLLLNRNSNGESEIGLQEISQFPGDDLERNCPHVWCL